MKCVNCGKGVMYGHEVSHAKNRKKRLFLPNLHKVRVPFGGATKIMRLCTKCLRLLKKKTTAKPKDQIPAIATV